jgi:acyl-homoserine lactone synthase
MYCDRKRIFFDALHWQIPVAAGIFEIDQFDTDDAIYLLDIAEGDQHLGSARLLPTTEPHILGSLFPQLCDDVVPTGSDIWEITRWCNAPRMRRDNALQSRERLGVALTEFAVKHGVTHFTCVAELPWITKLREIGWPTTLLGAPSDVKGEMLAALLIEVGPETLRDFRQRTGHREPILEMRGKPVVLKASNMEASYVA